MTAEGLIEGLMLAAFIVTMIAFLYACFSYDD